MERMPYLLPFDAAKLPSEEFDFLIIGSGVAGLSCAIELEDYGTVAVLTKEGISEGSTQWAQGGIAAVLSPEPLDSPLLHQQDTMQAGAGLCDRAAVDVLVNEGPHRIRQLIARGAHFDTEPSGALKLTREAAHRARRIVHSGGDATGKEVQRSLSASALGSERISVFEDTVTIDFLLVPDGEGKPRCIGVLAFDQGTGEFKVFRGKATIAATGGIGALYKVTTNPPVLTGDGMAMAYRAGANLMDMEFVQFHPTAFAKGPNNPKFLISEAVRGEGAFLLNNRGERFMMRYHPDAELAPRDVVSRAIAQEILETGADYVTLDFTSQTAQQIAARFPKIYSTCVAYGIDPATEPIPVSPAEHYMMGGIRTGLDGETNIPGLLACGECACTGVHGANRLASNSMLEGLVFGIRTVQAAIRMKNLPVPSSDILLNALLAAADMPSAATGSLSSPDAATGASDASMAPTLEELNSARAQLQETMWKYAGLVRNGKGLQTALASLDELEARYGQPNTSPELLREAIELANMICVARLVVQSALTREESRGAHYRTDFPATDTEHWQYHILLRQENGQLILDRAATS
jgi:L-aspartate oxidase